jgi:hypothetical protein
LARWLAGTDWDILPDGVDDFQAAFVATPGAGLLKIFSGVNRAHIFRILGFSPRLAYRIGRLELYAAQRPARFDDFFLPP